MAQNSNQDIKISIIVPTYNRRRILEKVLLSLENQTYPAESFEVVVIDDGSSDGTMEMLSQIRHSYSLVVLTTGRKPGAEPGNPATARNKGILAAKGDLLVFLDSDMVVVPGFLAAHFKAQDNPAVVGHGPFIQTSNFDDPFSEPMKWTDASRAFFATGNSSIRKRWLLEAGLFDEDFVEYGWEDLELGIRLKRLGLTAVKVPEAIGYHYKPATYENRLEDSIAREESRARMAIVFYRKHRTFEVQLMTLIFPLFFILEGFISLGGWPDRHSTRRLISRFEKSGNQLMVLFLSKFVTLHAYARTLREELRSTKPVLASRK